MSHKFIFFCDFYNLKGSQLRKIICWQVPCLNVGFVLRGMGQVFKLDRNRQEVLDCLFQIQAWRTPPLFLGFAFCLWPQNLMSWLGWEDYLTSICSIWWINEQIKNLDYLSLAGSIGLETLKEFYKRENKK